MEAKGYKCSICGAESDMHDEHHQHGEPPSDRHCMPKCAGCGQAEDHCPC